MGYREKRRVKCSNCGTPTDTPALRKLRGVIKWFCGVCATRMDRVNG